MERDGHCFHRCGRSRQHDGLILLLAMRSASQPKRDTWRAFWVYGQLFKMFIGKHECISVVSPNVDVFSILSSYSVTCMYQCNLPGPQIMCFKEACLLCSAALHKVEGSGPLIFPLQAKPYPAILQVLFIKISVQASHRWTINNKQYRSFLVPLLYGLLKAESR